MLLFLKTSGRLGPLFLFACLLVLRMPQPLLTPRFFENEGPNFFGYAWHVSTWQALGHVYGGYLNLACNVAVWLDVQLIRGGLLSLESAPVLTEGIGFIFQLFPAIIVLWGRAEWLRGRWVAPMILAAIAFVPRGEEIWLQSLHIQMSLALATALMLVTEAEERGFLRVFRLGILGLGPLSGPAPIIFLPLFVVRTLFEKNRARVEELALFALATLVQILIFSDFGAHRPLRMSVSLLLNAALVRQVLDVFLGLPLSYFASAALIPLYKIHDWRFALSALLTALLLGGGMLLALRCPRHPASWLYAAALCSILGYMGGLGEPWWYLYARFGGHYSFVPNALLMITPIALFATASDRYKNLFAGGLGWLAVISIFNCTAIDSFWSHGPHWRDEVAAWRRNSHYHMRVWPDDGRFIDLSDGPS